MKKYSFVFILLEIAVMIGITCIPTAVVAFFQEPGKNLEVLTFILVSFLMFMLHILLANRILFPLARRTMKKEAEKEGFVISHLFENREDNSCASLLAIDEIHRKIAYISVHNPFQFQTADVKDLSGVNSGFVEGPFSGTRYVYYQFYYRGKRLRIPTFTARQMHFLSATIVQKAMDKANLFRDIIEALTVSM